MQTIVKSALAEREKTPSSMPAIHDEVVTKAELRDLVACVASLRVAPITAAPRATASGL
jgi:hypothetical protein